MQKTLMFALSLSPLVAAISVQLSAQSVFTSRLDDSRAVYAAAPAQNQADSTAALQAAIDRAAGTGREGIVFVPSGRYRLTHTLYIWPGVRVFGYGATRPVFVLPANTPGFETGIGDMVIFTGVNPKDPTVAHGRIPFPPPGSVPPNGRIADANSSTFYSAMSNIDFEIGEGNPAAVAIRFHVAQHAFLTHMNFRIGSGLAALTQVGNEAEDLHFYGGR
ncbi:MAG TPA: glycosyl hydrolase family 28-related protein, partial [Terracidiphilus sp.]|nr:glycosyl hydrolase family 28-related protein [Terracidiphilus sp.]